MTMDAEGTPRGGIRPVRERWPRTVDEALVVAALDTGRLVSLEQWAPDTLPLEPVTTRSPEGREILRRSAGLALLEAARRIGLAGLRIGASLRSGRVVTVDPPTTREELVARAPELSLALTELIAADLAFGSEAIPVEQAEARFRDLGWTDAVALLELAREASVDLVTLGETRALRMGVTLPTTGALAGISIGVHPAGLVLDFGPFIRRELEPRSVSTVVLEARAPRYGSLMTRQQRDWLQLLGVRSVGDLGRACVRGDVRELIHVSEGFHEKHIAQIADEVRARGAIRVLCIAGPSSSGKTTFIRRLRVQLQVNGTHPWPIGLDDYYVDRERTTRDEQGELDFEAVEAIDLELLAQHVAALLRGEPVRLPRFDFVAGRSLRESSPPMQLGVGDVLLVEGIHALNPRLLALFDPEQTFRIFVHPASPLPFDRLTVMEPADVRLIRRIVRDRHGRGHGAADTLARWPSVRRGERRHIEPNVVQADCVFDTSLIYELCVLKIFAERYLLEVPRGHPQRAAATRLRALLAPFVPIEPDQVPATSILREFVGGSAFTD